MGQGLQANLHSGGSVWREEDLAGGRRGPQRRRPRSGEGPVRTGRVGGGAVGTVALDWELPTDASLVPHGGPSSVSAEQP